ncbi:MAG: C25 family cysteine peptidase, partial [Ignavibacteriaceae bacterium]
MIKILRLLFLLLLLSVPAFGQVKIIDENISGTGYTLKVKLESHPYEIKTFNGKSLILFPPEISEYTHSNLILPARDIFIAVPPGSKPSIAVTPVVTKLITAEPELTPIANAVNDSTIKYTKRENPDRFPDKKSFEIKGYLWLRNNYVVHIQLNQYVYEYDKQAVTENQEYEIRFNFGGSLPLAKSGSTSDVESVILNKSFASGFQLRPVFNLNNNDEWIDYSKTYLKLGVAQDAIYRLNYNDLVSAGVPVNSIDPRTFSLINTGNEIPVYVSGEEDGQFNESDFIEFAGIRTMGGNHRAVSLPGESYHEYLGRYTDTTVYWLTWGGETGQRVEVSNVSQSSGDTLIYYHEIMHTERNNWFDFSMEEMRRQLPFWYENKTWNEGDLGVPSTPGNPSKNISFNLSDIYPNSTVKLYAKLQSRAWGTTGTVANAHLLAISLNSFPRQDSGYISSYQQKLLTAEYNSGSISNGVNTVRIFSFPTGNTSINLCIYDWTEIEYPRYLKPVNDSLNFFFPYLTNSTHRPVKITNVQTSDFSLWRYGSSLKKYIVNRNGDELIFSDTIRADDKFIFNGISKIKSPKIYYLKQFDNLKASGIQADYIAITHKLFKQTVADYTQFISSWYNVNTAIIDVEDIYDQFSYGYFNPESIKDFLQSTHAFWQEPLPKYIVLIGSASYDYHYNKVKFQSLSPVINYVPSFGAAVSDNWFVTWDSTGAYIPRMNIGRLPVRTLQELEYYISKHQGYVQQDYDEWNKSFLFFSGGNNTDEGEINQLKGVNDFILNNYVKPAPVGGNSTHFYKTKTPPTDFGPYTPQEIQSAISKGGAFISYIGHSGTQTWDNTITEPAQLKNNKNKFPLITDFGCSTARFAEPDIKSFSQLFMLDPDGQAIAYIGNSSLGYFTTSTTFPQIFYRRLLVDSVYNISEALKTGKMEMLQNSSPQVYQLFALTNTLIGDPIVSLAVPSIPNLQITPSGISSIIEKPTDNLDSILFKIEYLNLGRALTDTFKLRIENTWQDSITFSRTYSSVLPLFRDSLLINIPINKMPGDHSLKIVLDADNEINEIKENDNEVNYNYHVSSSSLRTLFSYAHEKSLTDDLVLLSPSQSSSGTSIEVELSRFPDFSNPVTITHPLDTFYTKISLAPYDAGRFWLRARISGEEVFNQEQSFFLNSYNGYRINDSLTFGTASLNNIKVHNTRVGLDTGMVILTAMSAGYRDGNTVLITKNGENLIPENTLRGHHVSLLDAETYDVELYKWFDIREGPPSVTTDYINFLDTLSEDYIVIIAISSYASVANATLKEKIKSLGSVYIDSLVGFGSWAMIGRKGAVPGSVPEAVSRELQGRVEIDTTILVPQLNGNMLTSLIGPSSGWENLYVQQDLVPGSDIRYKPVGIKQD